MMKKSLAGRLAVVTMAAAMMGGVMIPRVTVFANDGRGIYAEKDAITIKDLNRDAVVTASSANVREGISTKTSILNSFNKGHKFHIDGVAYRNGEQTDWYRVIVADKLYGGECSGYIHKSTFEFTDNEEAISQEFKDFMDKIYSAQPGTAGGSQKTMEAGIAFQAYAFDHAEDLSVGEIEYAAECYLKEKTAENADFAASFKECFEAVCEANSEADETLEGDVSYQKFVNGIQNAITNVMQENKEDDKDQKEVKCEFKVEKASKNMKAAQDVYVRKGPKTTFDIMGAFVKGADVKVTGQVFKHGNKACWVQVDYKGATGYVCTDYLK